MTRRKVLYDPACLELARHFVSIPNGESRTDEDYERECDRLAQDIQLQVEETLAEIEEERF